MRMVIQPRRKILTKRSWVARRDREAGTSSGASGKRVLSGIVSSARPPTLSPHKGATATATHSRAARCGSVIRVRGPCPPPRLVIVKPCSLQARNPYQPAAPALGARAVSNNHGSVEPASQRASRVQVSRRRGPGNAVPVPTHCVPGWGTNLRSG